MKESRRRHRASPQAAMQLEDHEHGLFLGSPPFSTQQRLASSSTIHESMPPAAGFGVGTAQIDPSLTLGTRLSARTIPSYSAFGAMPAVQGQGECVRPPWPAMFTFQRGFGEERQLIQVNFQVQHIPSSYHVRSPQWSAGWPGAGPSLNQGFPLMQSLASVESPGTHDDLFSQPFHPVHKMPSRDQVSASPQQKYALGDGQLARPRRRLPNSAPHTKTASAGYQTIVPRTTRSSLTAQQQQQQQQQQNHHHHRHHSKQHSSYQATGAFAANTEGTGDARSSQSSKSKKGHDVTPQLAADEDRTAKDRFLLEKRLEGMSYKDIRIRGGFSEAESTLRGRHRTLTKTREARVRRPEWTDIDVSRSHKFPRLCRSLTLFAGRSSF